MGTFAEIATEPRQAKMKYWYLFIATVLVIWASLVLGLGLLSGVTRQWPISVVMILGSFIAGSTPMGGGSVSFPFLVLWLHIPPDTARTFGLCIQSLGMVSAMVFILCRLVRIQGRMLLWTIAGAAAGMAFGTAAITPRIAPNFVKLLFACMWMSFGLLQIIRSREFCSLPGIRNIDKGMARRTGLLVGILGGIIASIIGVGVEMILYTVLVLLYRSDLKIAVPTAVSAMAVTAVMGVATHLALGDIPRDVGMKVLAAGPVVIFGAPIGAYVLSVIPRVRTLYLISVLCVVQFVWTLYSLQRTRAEWAFVAVAMILAGQAFYWMYRAGRRPRESSAFERTRQEAQSVSNSIRVTKAPTPD